MGSHIRHHPSFASEMNGEENGDEPSHLVGRTGAEPISQDLLRKYIVYSKEKVRPKLHQMDQDKVAKLYADLRKESMVSGWGSIGSVSVAKCAMPYHLRGQATYVILLSYNQLNSSHPYTPSE